MEVALSQLDTLTKEENLIAARSSEVTYNNNVRAIEDGTCHSLVIFQACPDPLPAISETASEEFIRLLPMPRSLIPKLTQMQEVSCKRNFEPGSLLQILPSIIEPHVIFSIVGLQPGSSKAIHSMNGRRTVPYCGSVDIVRSPSFLAVFNIDSVPDFQRDRGKPFFGT